MHSPGLSLFGLPAEAPGDGLASFPPLGVPEGMGTLFGSPAEPMPEEQTTLAGGLMVVGGVLGGGLPVP